MKEYVVKVFEDGSRCWYLDGERHCEDGPAVEFSNGSKVWYLNGERVTEEEHKRRTSKTRNATPLEQVLKDAWYAGYNAAMERVTHDTETSAAYDFEKYMVRIIESLEKGEEHE